MSHHHLSGTGPEPIESAECVFFVDDYEGLHFRRTGEHASWVAHWQSAENGAFSVCGVLITAVEGSGRDPGTIPVGERCRHRACARRWAEFEESAALR